MFDCSSDALFDILFEKHLSIGHGGRVIMLKKLNHLHQNITQNDTKIFLSVCEPWQQQQQQAEKKGVVVVAMVLSRCLLYTSRCV